MTWGTWRERSQCLNLDTNMFFDRYEEDTDLRYAIDDLCKKCPVRKECLADAVTMREWGVRGGVYLEGGKLSKEFNSHKNQQDWFEIWKSVTLESK